MLSKQTTLNCAVGFCLGLAGSAPAAASEFEYDVTLYGWLAGIGSRIDTVRGPVTSDLSFGDILEDLDGAFMGVFEARRGRMIFLADLQYTATASDEGPPFGVLFSGTTTETQLSIASAFVLYRQIDRPELTLDLGAGLRYADVNIGVTLQGGTLPTQSILVDDAWVDPVLALRFARRLSDTWQMTGFFDVGGFGMGSDLSWQALVGFTYQINDRWSARAGYRHLHIDRSNNARGYELDLSGPIIGATYRF